MNVQVYFSPVGGVTSAVQHVFIYSPDQQTGRGSDFFGKGTQGLASLNNPSININLTRSQYSKILSYPGWDRGIFVPFINDCHVQLENAFDYAGVGYKYPNNNKVLVRINPKRTFEGNTSFAADLREIGYEFFNPREFNEESCSEEIARVIYNYVRNKHKYKSRSGTLNSSLRIQKQSSNITKVYFSAPYADAVLVKTKDPVFNDAVRNNEDNIKSIFQKHYERSIYANEHRISNMIERFGHRVFTNEFDKILLSQ